MTTVTLTSEDRLRLMRFLCAFAWADLEIHDEERSLVARFCTALDLTAEERVLVDGWLESPPRPEEIDPQEIPEAHRELFLMTVSAMVSVDGTVNSREAETLQLLAQLLTGDDYTEEWATPLLTEEIEPV